MHTNEKLLFKEEVFRVVGCAIEVLNTLGHGLVEKSYENALVVEFRLQGIPFQHQPSFDILYKGYTVGLFVPDPIAFNTILVDAKLMDGITDDVRRLMLNYLRPPNAPAGVVCTSK